MCWWAKFSSNRDIKDLPPGGIKTADAKSVCLPFPEEEDANKSCKIFGEEEERLVQGGAKETPPGSGASQLLGLEGFQWLKLIFANKKSRETRLTTEGARFFCATLYYSRSDAGQKQVHNKQISRRYGPPLRPISVNQTLVLYTHTATRGSFRL